MFVMAGLVPAIHVLGAFRLYVGVTNDLVCRVFEHRSGFVDGLSEALFNASTTLNFGRGLGRFEQSSQQIRIGMTGSDMIVK